MNAAVLGSLPVVGSYVGVAVAMLVSYEIGFRFGGRVHKRTDASASLGPMVGGLLGMLAFVLAMTFSMAASQHDLRRKSVLEEANAVGTAYLRSDLLDPQYRTEVRKLLREYVDVRLDAATGGDVHAAIVRSVEIHGLLWAQVSAAALAAPSTNTALMVQSTNDVIDMHEKRVTAGLRYRIPGTVWIALSAIAILTMIVLGVQSSLAGRAGLVAVVPLSLAFAALIVLVVDLDRPETGMITVNQQAMVNLQKSMSVHGE